MAGERLADRPAALEAAQSAAHAVAMGQKFERAVLCDEAGYARHETRVFAVMISLSGYVYTVKISATRGFGKRRIEVQVDMSSRHVVRYPRPMRFQASRPAIL